VIGGQGEKGDGMWQEVKRRGNPPCRIVAGVFLCGQLQTKSDLTGRSWLFRISRETFSTVLASSEHSPISASTSASFRRTG